MTKDEELAVERCKQAGVTGCTDAELLTFVRQVGGAKQILESPLADILEVANAF